MLIIQLPDIKKKSGTFFLSNAIMIKFEHFWENFSGGNYILSGKSPGIYNLPICGNLCKQVNINRMAYAQGTFCMFVVQSFHKSKM